MHASGLEVIFNIIVTIGDCIHFSLDLKFVGKAIHENNEYWIPTNKKYFTVFKGKKNSI